MTGRTVILALGCLVSSGLSPWVDAVYGQDRILIIKDGSVEVEHTGNLRQRDREHKHRWDHEANTVQVWKLTRTNQATLTCSLPSPAPPASAFDEVTFTALDEQNTIYHFSGRNEELFPKLKLVMNSPVLFDRRKLRRDDNQTRNFRLKQVCVRTRNAQSVECTVSDANEYLCVRFKDT